MYYLSYRMLTHYWTINLLLLGVPGTESPRNTE